MRFYKIGRSPTGRAIRCNLFLPQAQHKKSISATIPNAKQELRACCGIVFGRKNKAFLSETRQILQP
jgi:hypothetical protein